MRNEQQSTDAIVNESVPTNAVTQPQIFAPLGEVLAEARAAKKYSQKDASNYLRYSIAQVNALENNDFSALPQPMITRGFIRNYARYLELDATPLLESYKQRVPEAEPYAVRVKSDSYEVMDNKASLPWLKYILGSILLLLFLLAWMLYVEFLPKNLLRGNTVTLPEVATDNAEAVSEISLPAEAIVSEDNTISEASALNATESASTDDRLANGSTQEGNKTVANGVAESANSTHTANPLTSSTGQPLASVQTHALGSGLLNPPNISATNNNVVSQQSTSQASVMVRADTWVQATDADGNVVLEKIVPAGTSVAIAGTKPFNVIIGNAKAASLTYAGKSLDLAPYTTENNVARIKLE